MEYSKSKFCCVSLAQCDENLAPCLVQRSSQSAISETKSLKVPLMRLLTDEKNIIFIVLSPEGSESFQRVCLGTKPIKCF